MKEREHHQPSSSLSQSPERALKDQKNKKQQRDPDNNDYCSKNYFPSACQISCNSDLVAQIISTSVFLPYTI